MKLLKHIFLIQEVTKKKIFSGVIGIVGFLLSPVSWWNDIIINFPLSYLMAIPFGLINRGLFLPMFIVSYWVTNILGLILMHFGINGVIRGQQKITRDELFKTIIFCVIYSLVITLLVQYGVLELPIGLLDRVAN